MSTNKPTIRLNVLAKHVENAREIVEAADGRVLIGVMVKAYPDADAAAAAVESFQRADVPVSVGLGAGDPTQWKKVAEVAARTKPAHVNQVFPAAGYTLGRLQQAGSGHTLVNALIAPSGTPGRVIVSTGPVSGTWQETVSCEAAAAMLAEIGVHSVKFYPVNGCERLDELRAMARAAVRCGLSVFEPTGGIDASSIRRVVETCLEEGVQQVIPHIYTSIVDKATGLTRTDQVKELIAALPHV
ncbi:oxo-acid lyase [Brevibacillus sp. LEMMJ03]|uniref:KDGP aldolase n=1 Tax=unclassified Brevibacillus TaxID=2684853 RepID=UPI0005D0ED68|nr:MULTISPECIES: KDGP aldolase [unclassified Brevibacillus]TRY27281.1 oxo-acid lyase [Brevibacillus sp. LEMMJ03]UYZ12503.1 KDGP aldolase [Brevibacillus sp. WF146]